MLFFNIRERLFKSCLNPCYEDTLNELIDFFSHNGTYSTCNDDELITALKQFYEYKAKNKEQGIGFVKDKIIDLLLFRIEQGDTSIVFMIRNALHSPPKHEAA